MTEKRRSEKEKNMADEPTETEPTKRPSLTVAAPEPEPQADLTRVRVVQASVGSPNEFHVVLNEGEEDEAFVRLTTEFSPVPTKDIEGLSAKAALSGVTIETEDN